MEKLGVERQELLSELRGKYQLLREKQANFEKTGSPTGNILAELAQVKEKIDEVERSG